MTLTIYDKIAIIELVFFFPALPVAVLLAWRHGIRRSSGWIYLVILALIRIIGACMELATISNPDSTGLLTGAQITQSIGLSPLILILLGLIARAYASIPDGAKPRIPNQQILRLLQTVVVVGLILTIVGGVNAGSQVGDDLKNGTPVTYTVQTVSKVGVALFIVGYVLLALFGLIIGAGHLSSLPNGEKRLLLAVGASLPFVGVRLIYSILSVFDTSNANFRQFGGSTDAGYYVLGLCTIMEIIAVIIFEAVGLTLAYVPHSERGQLIPGSANSGNSHQLQTYPDNGQQQRLAQQQYPPQGYPQQQYQGQYYPKPTESV